jgi:hypothetical protein
MFLVLLETRLHRDTEGGLDNRDVQSQTLEHRVKLSIEGGHRDPIMKFQSLLCTRLRGDRHEMFDEIETDLEPPRLIDRNTTCRETADVWKQSHVPPVVSWRHISQLDLPDDLEPKMECVFRFGPGF